MLTLIIKGLFLLQVYMAILVEHETKLPINTYVVLIEVMSKFFIDYFISASQDMENCLITKISRTKSVALGEDTNQCLLTPQRFIFPFLSWLCGRVVADHISKRNLYLSFLFL